MAKTVLITGCSSGFGRGLVSLFLKRDWNVVATLRRPAGQLDGEKSGRLTVLPLDITSAKQRAEARARLETLDCLVNNAGYGVFGALEATSEEQLRRQMEVNFFGTALLTRELLPLLRASKGRIINVSSLLGVNGMPLASAYAASKFAVEGLTESLYYELHPHGVQVALVEPGGFRTRFNENLQWGEGSWDEGSCYLAQSRGLAALQRRHSQGPGTSPESVIRKIVELAEMRRMPLRVPCGRDMKALNWLKRLIPSAGRLPLFRMATTAILAKQRGEAEL